MLYLFISKYTELLCRSIEMIGSNNIKAFAYYLFNTDTHKIDSASIYIMLTLFFNLNKKLKSVLNTGILCTKTKYNIFLHLMRSEHVKVFL